MAKGKGPKTDEGLEGIKEELIHEFHVCCMDIIGHLRVVEEGINKFNGQSLTLGEAASWAKAATDDQDIRKTWILFGDPTTRLR